MKNICIAILICFLVVALAPSAKAKTLYQDSSYYSEETLNDQNKSDYEKHLKKIQEKQHSGQLMFWTGVGLNIAYLYTLLTANTKNGSILFLFGLPIISIGLAWYGFGETVAANQEEAVLMYQHQKEVSNEAK
ncbi:MAG: hypothetical protein WCT39_03890 [Candidatus Margulisiibacteriota bacterium]